MIKEIYHKPVFLDNIFSIFIGTVEIQSVFKILEQQAYLFLNNLNFILILCNYFS